MSIEEPFKEPQGLDRRPQEATIKTTSKGAKVSLAQPKPYVGSDVPHNTFVTKEELKIFATDVFTLLAELKSSIQAPALKPTTDSVLEALKANTEMFKSRFQIFQ